MNALQLAARKHENGFPRLSEKFMELSVGSRGLSMMDAPRRIEGDLRKPYRALQIR